jgi:carbon monoxide dehydrogenase subunit G
MKLTSAHRLPAPPARVFAALTDPAILCRCIEGCESLVASGEHSYDARLRIGLGSIKGTYTGTARLTELDPPKGFVLIVDGKGTAGWARGSARMQLAEDGDQTNLTSDADVQVGGAIAAVGSRLIDAAARRLSDRFFESLARELAAPPLA